MIRGAGRLKRMDERAAFPTPGDTPACSSIGPDGFVCTQEPWHWGDHEAWGWSGLMKAWPSRPDAVRDGRHLFENERAPDTIETLADFDAAYREARPAVRSILEGAGAFPTCSHVVAEEHDGVIVYVGGDGFVSAPTKTPLDHLGVRYLGVLTDKGFTPARHRAREAEDDNIVEQVINDVLIAWIDRNPRTFAPSNPHYVKNHVSAPGTVRSWFRQMRAADFARDVEGVTSEWGGHFWLIDKEIWRDRWTVFDTQQVVDRETAAHYDAPTADEIIRFRVAMRNMIREETNVLDYLAPRLLGYRVSDPFAVAEIRRRFGL